jgi:hypothetical protein
LDVDAQKISGMTSIALFQLDFEASQLQAELVANNVAAIGLVADFWAYFR